MAFLSLLDDRLKTKGSRDPLGFEQVWTKFGREVVGNLTTITNSLENFAVALLGFHWANELNQDANDDDKQKRVSSTFLKYEQLAAYLRYKKTGSNSIMGITKVKARMDDEERMVFDLGTKNTQTILSDQVGYGLWGFYSSASRDSGLIYGNQRELTAKGFKITQLIESKVDKDKLLNSINQGQIDRSGIEELSQQFLAAINSEEVTELLMSSLMEGRASSGNDPSLQDELWKNTQKLFKDRSLALNDLGDYFVQIKRMELSGTLNKRLENIERVERVLTALNHVFHFCRACGGRSVEEAAEELNNMDYCFDNLQLSLPLLGEDNKEVPNADLINQALIALKDNDYVLLIRKLAQLNKKVMVDRGGAAWVEVDDKKKLKVRVKLEKFKLLKQDKLSVRWDYDYFFGSFLSISRTYLGASGG